MGLLKVKLREVIDRDHPVIMAHSEERKRIYESKVLMGDIFCDICRKQFSHNFRDQLSLDSYLHRPGLNCEPERPAQQVLDERLLEPQFQLKFCPECEKVMEEQGRFDGMRSLGAHAYWCEYSNGFAEEVHTPHEGANFGGYHQMICQPQVFMDRKHISKKEPCPTCLYRIHVLGQTLQGYEA